MLCKVQQWKGEIDKHCKPGLDLNVTCVTVQADHASYTYQNFLEADFIIFSIQFLQNKGYYDRANGAKTKDRTDNVRMEFQKMHAVCPYIENS